MITVLMAAYQGEAYIREQLDSIMGQTLPGIRVLVSDDGSVDGTWEIIEEYMKRYPQQVKGVRHEKKSDETLHPAAANFFWLLSQAEGEHIMLSDQDDVWKADKAERMMEAMVAAEAKEGADRPILIYSDAEVVDCHLEQIAPSFLGYQRIGAGRTKLNQILVENPVTGGAVMMNRALLSYLRKAPARCFMHDWWIALTASCFGTIRCIREPLYLYRQHGKNTLGAKQTGSAEDVVQRLGRGEQVKEHYRQMFEQASCFLEHYSERLEKDQAEILRAFLSLPYKGVVGRICTVRRYQFYKSSRLQTAAQCLTIPGK